MTVQKESCLELNLTHSSCSKIIYPNSAKKVVKSYFLFQELQTTCTSKNGNVLWKHLRHLSLVIARSSGCFLAKKTRQSYKPTSLTSPKTCLQEQKATHDGLLQKDNSFLTTEIFKVENDLPLNNTKNVSNLEKLLIIYVLKWVHLWRKSKNEISWSQLGYILSSKNMGLSSRGYKML